jgi:hypothetical protein
MRVNVTSKSWHGRRGGVDYDRTAQNNSILSRKPVHMAIKQQ